MGIAQTYVGGVYNSSQTWTLSGSPYVLTNNVSLSYSTYSPGLTIRPGVVVDLGNYSLTIGSASTLHADSAQFTSSTGAQIRFTYSNSDAYIRHSILNKVSVVVTSASPDISNNVITGNQYPFSLATGGAGAPTFYNNDVSGNTYQQIAVYGTNSGYGSTWRNFSLPYVLTSNVSLTYYNYDAGLTIQPGVVVDLGNYSLTIGSASTLHADSAQFTSSTGAQIRFTYSNSDAYIRHSILNKVSVVVTSASPDISNNSFAGNNDCISVSGSSKPLIINNDFLVAPIFFGVTNSSTTIVDARNNYWGDPSGPTHQSNPMGNGTKVSDNVDFVPFRVSPNNILSSVNISIGSNYNPFNFQFLPNPDQGFISVKVSNVNTSQSALNIQMFVIVDNNKLNLYVENSTATAVTDLTLAEVKPKNSVNVLAVLPSSATTIDSKKVQVIIQSINGVNAGLTTEDYVSNFPARNISKQTFSMSKDAYNFSNKSVSKITLSEVVYKLSIKGIQGANEIYQMMEKHYSGRCWGMVATAGSYFLGYAKPTDGDPYTWDMGNVLVMDKITTTHIAQTQYSSNLVFGGSSTWNTLVGEMKKGNPVLLVLDKPTPPRHVVLATRVNYITAAKKALIEVYDSDSPNMFDNIILDLNNYSFNYHNYQSFAPVVSNVFSDIDKTTSKSNILSTLFNALTKSGKKSYSVACPVYLSLTNSTGQKAGYLDDGTFVSEIPGTELYRSWTGELSGDSITTIHVPSNDTYFLKVKAFNSGYMRYESYQPIREDSLIILSADSIRLQQSTIIQSDEAKETNLRIDLTGNGSSFSTITLQQSTFLNTTVGVNIPTRLISRSFSIEQNFPNPFNPSTTIRYGLPARSSVRIIIYNVLGQVIKELLNTEQQAGIQSVVWKANVSSGLYFYRLEATSLDNPSNRFIETKKMLLLK
jgi:parallel beta-helix repeat protein